MNAQERKDLLVAAAKVRLGIIEGVYHAKSGHPGGSLSSADIFTYLYFKAVSYTHLDVYKRQFYAFTGREKNARIKQHG